MWAGPGSAIAGVSLCGFYPASTVWREGLACALSLLTTSTFTGGAIWLGDWAVWGSSQHMPLFTRFREAFGKKRPLIEAPGQLLTPEEADDAVSIISVSLLFRWNCHMLTDSDRDAVFTSHDEFGWFASRDPAVTASAREKIGGALQIKE